MKLIVWLWNPWNKYYYTKHNIWFLFLDFLKNKEDFWDFKYESKFKWEITFWSIKWKKIILLKPHTFMNLSWQSVISLIKFYKINIDDIIIIYDDFSMEFWKIRFRSKWSSWWHNWIKDIIKYLWENFKRIKIWIWYNKNYNISDWVLSNFNKNEIKILEEKVFNNTYVILFDNFL